MSAASVVRGASLAVIVALLCCDVRAGGPPVFAVTERLGEDWIAERLTFAADLPHDFDEGSLCVRTAKGRLLPAQFTADEEGSRTGTVSFVTDLSAFQSESWTLCKAAADLGEADILVRESDADVVFGTSRIAVRCPAGSKEWAGGVPISEVPPPISGVAVARAGLIETGGLAGQQNVVSMAAGIVERGPVSVKCRVRYAFAGGGTWTVTMEAIAGQEVVLITEQMDVTAGTVLLEGVRLAGTPAGNYVMQAYGSRLLEQGSYWSIGLDGLKPNRIAWQPLANAWPSERMDAKAPGDFAVPSTPGPIATLHPSHGEWWLNGSQWVGFYRDNADPYLGILALRGGTWKSLRENAIAVEKTPEGSLRAILPITTGVRYWALYASTRQAAAAAPPDVEEPPPVERPGREFARPPHLATIKYGLLPLDVVRAWTPELSDPAGFEHPFVFARRQSLVALRGQIAKRPDFLTSLKAASGKWTAYVSGRPADYPFYPRWLTEPMMLDNLYLATGKEQYAKAMAALLVAKLRYYVHQTKAGVGITGFRISHDYGMFHIALGVLPRALREADLVLGAPSVPQQLKQDIRALLSFWGALLASSDYQPEGANNGNTDMIVCRDAVVGGIGCLLPHHPRAASWRAIAAHRIDDALDARNHFPAVTQDEWYGHLTLDLCVWCAVMLKRAGDRDFFKDERLRNGLEFYGQLLVPPDPRYGHGYVVPFGQGQAQWNRSAQCGLAAAALAREDPGFASRMMWYWERAGRPLTLKFMPADDVGVAMLPWIDGAVEARNPGLTSKYLDGWGFIFRDQYGLEDETFLAVQAGKPGGLLLHNAEGGLQYHALGMPMCLVPGIRGYDTQIHGGQANLTRQRWMANRPSFGDSSEQDEGTGKITAWITSPAADYASAEWTFSRFEAITMPQPDSGPDALVLSSPRGIPPSRVFQTSSPVRWRRQIMFVKPNAAPRIPYVVIRDDVRSPVPWDTNIWCLASNQQVTADGAFFTGKFGVNLAAIPLVRDGEVVTGIYGPTRSFAGDYRQMLYQVQLPAESRSFATLLYPWRQGGNPPAVVPDLGTQGVRLTFAKETHVISSRHNGMALIRESESGSAVALFGAFDSIENKSTRVTMEGTRDLSSYLELFVTGSTVLGEVRGESREISIESPACSQGRLMTEDRVISTGADDHGKIRFTSPPGLFRFNIR
jgi:hypothetical protein